MCQPRDPCSVAVVRLAIGLAALKRKPRDQSIASYLLDLQSYFPVTTEKNVSRDWRTYALELEKQLATLKTQRDADQDLLSKLNSDASQVASTSDPPPPKKKSKKNHSKDQHDLEWNWDQLHWARILSSQYPSSPSLVAAYASLKGILATPSADPLSHISRIADGILRALDTIHIFLFSPPNPSPDSRILNPKHIDSIRIALASPLLMFILRTALHVLVQAVQDATKPKRTQKRLCSTDALEHIDKVLDNLLEGVLLPLLRAISPLCSARLAPLVSAPPKRDKDKVGRASAKSKGKSKEKENCTTSSAPPKRTDVRTDVFALIGASLGALDALPPLVRPPNTVAEVIACGIRDRLGLETIREIEALYAVPAPPTSLQPSSQVTTSEPPPPTPTPTLSAPPQSQSQSQPLAQHHRLPEPRVKTLEKLTETRAERVRALATRDAGWFLASTLNLCVTPVPVGPGVPARDTMGGVLREALLDRIGKLVRSMPLTFGVDRQLSGGPSGDVADAPASNVADPKFNIDPVCQNMLLAICERALSHLASS